MVRAAKISAVQPLSERGSKTPPAGAAAPGPGVSGQAAPPHPALRRLGVEVQGRIDEYLLRLDIELARRSATAAQRRATGVAVRNRILAKLAARIPPGSRPGGVHLSAADADIILAELGPVERHVDQAVPHKQAPPRYTGPRKLSKLALLGLIWAMMFPLMYALSRVPLDVSDQEPPWWYTLLQVIVIPLGWSSFIAPTVLGLMAIDRIRKSNGRQYGMSLAMFDAALFPLLVLDFAIFWICWQIADSLVAQQAIGEPLAKLITQVVPTVVCVLGDYFIVARAWMAVRED